MKREKILLSGVVLIVVLLVAVIVILLMRSGPKETAVTDSGAKFQADGNVITSSLSDEELEAMRKAQSEAALKNKVGVNFERSLKFSQSTSTGVGMIANPERNHYPMYFTIEVDGTEIVHTGLVPIGGRIEEFTLTSPLEKGTYEGYLVYHAVDEETQEIATESMPVVVDIIVGD